MSTPAREDAILRAGRRLILDSLAAETISALAAEGIPSILLKGPVTLRWLYAGVGGRSYGDVDLLVAPGDMARAGQCLRRLGMHRPDLGLRRSEAGRFYEESWSRGHAERVDLHQSFHGIRDAAGFWAAMQRHTEPLILNDTPVPGLDRTAAALIFALHAIQHGADEEQPVADLERALAVFDPAVWSDAYALAGEVGAAERFALGLRMLPTGAEIADRLQAPSLSTASVWNVMWHANALRTGTVLDRLIAVRDGVLPSRRMLAWQFPEAEGTLAARCRAYLRHWGRSAGRFLTLGTRLVAAKTWRRTGH